MPPRFPASTATTRPGAIPKDGDMTRFLLAPAVAFAVSMTAAADDPKTADPPKPPEAVQKADDKKADDKKDEKKEYARTPLEKFRDAKKAMDDAGKDFQAAIKACQERDERPSLNDPQIKKAYEAQNAARQEAGLVAIAAAMADPKSKDGADAIYFYAGMSQPGVINSENMFRLLLEHHASDTRLASVMFNWSYGPINEATTKFLESAEAKSKDESAVAVAKFVRGKSLVRSKDKAAEGEKLLDAVAKMSPDLKLFDRSIAKFAEGELFEFKFLSEGKTVPEIDGEDVEGSKFKISDYRGKVVMLDFWGHW